MFVVDNLNEKKVNDMAKVYECSNNTATIIAQYTTGHDGLVYQRFATTFKFKSVWGKWTLSSRKIDDNLIKECEVIEINHRAGKKMEKAIFIRSGIKIEIEKIPFATGKNLNTALLSIIESNKKEGVVMFECENDLRSNCNYEMLKFATFQIKEN